MINTDVVSKIKEVAITLDVIQQFIPLKKVGQGYKAKCPFHDEQSESFIVSPKLNIFKCFGCGKSGTSITFLMDHKGMSYPAALEFLANKYQISLK